MKKIALLFFGLALILTGCEEDKGYYLTGTVEGVENGKKVFISERDVTTNSLKPIDTATITDGKFEIDLEDQEQPGLSFLRFEGVNGSVVFISENQTIDFEPPIWQRQNYRLLGRLTIERLVDCSGLAPHFA